MSKQYIHDDVLEVLYFDTLGVETRFCRGFADHHHHANGHVL